MDIARGDIYFADLRNPDDSVQCGRRPVIVIQNNVGNAHSPTTLIVPLTSRMKKRSQPTHVLLRASQQNGLRCDSVALLEQVQTVNKSTLISKLGTVEDMAAIDKALMISLGLTA